MSDVPKLAQKGLGLFALDAAARVKISFSGSFQCRLATQGDGTDHKPTDKKGVYGQFSVGWTFAYRESEFDRVIRFSKPVQLRDALIDPWEDVKVTSVEAATTRGRLSLGGGGLSRISDPLVGNVVSLGRAKFDTTTGSKYNHKEAIINLALNIGGGLFTAEPETMPPMCKAFDPDIQSFAEEYKTKKPKLVQTLGAQMDPVRKAYLEEIRESDGELGHINGYAYSFEEIGTYKGKLKNVRCLNVSSVFNPKNMIEIPFDWTLALTFFRYDGDTLTGRVEGEILATAK